MSARCALVVAYDGTDFCGWQVQPNRRTVQGELEKALFRVLGRATAVTASGRTDSGVHAAGQVCHFDAETTIPYERMADCLNPLLPPDVKVLESFPVSDAFDANRTAKRKTYAYRMYIARRDNPVKERYAVRISDVNVDRMKEAARLIEGEHDFQAFCASGSSVKTTVRTVYEIYVTEGESFGSPDLTVRITGNGFLYNMVRTIVGELIEIGKGRFSSKRLEEALQTGDRRLVGKTMPARGLMLERVDYEEKNPSLRSERT